MSTPGTVEWKERVLRELKGKSADTLQVELEPGIQLDPILFEPASSIAHLIRRGRTSNDWQLCDYFHLNSEDPEVIHLEMLLALEQGTNGFYLDIDSDPGILGWDLLLKEVYLEGVSYYLNPAPQVAHATLKSMQQTGLCEKLQGGVMMHAEDFNSANLCTASIPALRSYGIPIRHTTYPSEGLLEALHTMENYVTHPKREQLPHFLQGGQIWWQVEIGDDFFREITNIRALRILWYHCTEAMGWSDPPPAHIVACIPANSGNPEDDLIYATLRTLAAVLGGCDVIVPKDVTVTGHTPADHRRWLRNIQHILKQESFLDKTVDPLQGSYLCDALAVALAEKVWKKFSGI